MRLVLLCMLEAVEGGLQLLESLQALEVCEMLETPKVLRYATKFA